MPNTLAASVKKLDEFFLISQIATSRKMAAMLGLGFSAGLPIMLVYQVLSMWLRTEDVSRSAIGFFVWVGFAYSLKFLWAPLVDRFSIPGFSSWLGNRRGWTLFSILATALAMLAMSFQDPGTNLANVAVCAVLIALSSATLDICVDAWRVDSAANEEQAMMSAVYQLGYRLGMIMAVSGGLLIADLSGYQGAYIVLGIIAIIGASTTLWAGEPTNPDIQKNVFKTSNMLPALFKGLAFLALIGAFFYFGLKDGGYLRVFAGYVAEIFTSFMSLFPAKYHTRMGAGFFIFILCLPFLAAVYFLTLGRNKLNVSSTFSIPILGDFADIVRRTGWMSLAVLAIVATYRISDTTMGVMAGPLYVDLGYSETTIGSIKGVFGISVLIFGAFLGGWAATKYGLAKALIAGAVLTIITNLAFAWLATISAPKAYYLLVTIGADNIAAGFAGSVFIAFMSIMTNRKFSASQYALFSSLFAFYGKSLAGFSGVLADKIGYEAFFIVTALFGIPALILVIFTWLNGFTDKIMAGREE
ncbi:MAG: MFS transporter [Hellea sp.]|nr:MFS transporter [Hellea sp.]